MTQIKRYFAHEFSHTLKSRARVSEQVVDSVERQNERQNKALAFIAALQVITLYAFLLLSGYIRTTVIVTLLLGIGAAVAALGYLPPLLSGY